MQRESLCGQREEMRRRPEGFVVDLDDEEEEEEDELRLVLDWNSTSKFRKRFLCNPNLYSGGGLFCWWRF